MRHLVLGQLLVTRTPFRETAKFRPKAHQYKHIQTVDCGTVVSGCNGCFFVNAFAFNKMNRTQCEHAKLTSSSSTRATIEIESHSFALVAINSINSKWYHIFLGYWPAQIRRGSRPNRASGSTSSLTRPIRQFPSTIL